MHGKKNLVFDRSLVGPIGHVVKVATLKEYGVDKFFILENKNVDASQRNVIFVARGESSEHAESIASEASNQLTQLRTFIYQYLQTKSSAYSAKAR